MSRALIPMLVVLGLAAGAGAAAAAEEDEAEAARPVATGPLARAARGVWNIVISPLEIPATAHRVAEERGAFRGVWAGPLEGFGNGLVRLSAGVVELASAPLPFHTLPLYNKRLGERAEIPALPPTGVTRP